ncbi:MAG: hypothetical protein WD738_05935 [Pirellulales bacterium]
MKRTCAAWLAVWLTSLGLSLIVLGVLAIPRVSYGDDGDTGPYCNEGADPSLPEGCFGWCYSPKICNIHPIQLVCKCR